MNVYAGWYTSAPVPTENFLKFIKTKNKKDKKSN